jgi:serpin B
MKRFLISLLALAATGLGARADDKADLQAAVNGDTQFALDLYAQLRGQDGNLFFSPCSVSTALAMTRAGAKGDTAAEMDKVLHFTLGQDKLHPAYSALMKEINGDPGDKKRGYQLSTANALWGQKGYPFKADFLKIARDDYGGGLHDVDFIGATEKARQTINAWVEKETHDKIKELLVEGILSEYTRLVLTNAIYFKGDWASQFKKDVTKDAPFHLNADKAIDVPLMHQKGEFGFFDGGTFQALEMPYAGDALSMVVLLPKKVDGLADLEKGMTADKLAGWIGKIHTEKVIVSLPRFKTTQQMAMKNVLTKMGMPLAFSDQADLSGIGGEPHELFILDVIHKAYVDVNEEGTEADAATAVVVDAKSLVVWPEFTADHPFVFLIRDTRNGSILFLGRISDPTK